MLRKQLIEAQSHAAVAQARSLAGQAMTLANGSKLLVARLDAVEAKAMQVRALLLTSPLLWIIAFYLDYILFRHLQSPSMQKCISLGFASARRMGS